MKIIILATALFVSGCGYSQLNTEVVGQVKRVINNNPIICNGFTDVDLSLGVMRSGVGSMSTHDMKLTVASIADIHTLTKAAETGKLVKITYDEKRWTWCWNNYIVSKVEVIDSN